ncbi:MAG: hypothetical protein ACR2MD_15205 [Aridibacter sp.]
MNETKILLQTTIKFDEDDWHIGRFSLLRQHLESLKDEDGEELYEVVARNREEDNAGNDPILSNLGSSDFDEIWLFALDTGDGLSKSDCEGVTKFRQRGGGILATRDHEDMGTSLCTLGGVGKAHYFNSKQNDPREDRNQRDDNATKNIDFPNYHSGANGDYQKIEVIEPVHELLKKSDGSTIEYFPAHPHEGGIGKPEDDDSASVIAKGKSLTTENKFNLLVAFEKSSDQHGNNLGSAVAESSFHHLVDYNWDTTMGCPTFLEEPPGNEVKESPEKLEDIKTYVANLAKWLKP